MKIYSIASVFAASIMTILIVQVAITSSGLTPWQLFRSLCPYFANQSPQCAMLQQQQQLLQQQQQQFPSTTVPSTTVPSTTVPSTTVPSTTVPSTTVP
jgi:hypothetical protein